MRSRMLTLVLLIALLQLAIFTAVLAFGGEFRDLEAYAYGVLAERTESAGTYLENIWREKPAGTMDDALGEELLSGLPALRGTACYVLCHGSPGVGYAPLAHSGSAYNSLLGDMDVLRLGEPVAEGVWRVAGSDAGLVCSLRELSLRGEDAPAGAQWALFTVSDLTSAQHPLLFLRRMLVVAWILSLMAVAIAGSIGSGVLIKPLSDLSRKIKNNQKYNEVVRFQPSNIYELDEITDAITQMQINVHGYSSQVSKMISIADVGLGTFMYDRTEDSVFVGQSLIKVLRLGLPQGEDVVMRRQEFLSGIENPEVRALIAAGLGMGGGPMQGDQTEVHQVVQPDGSPLWLRLGFTYSPNTAIGTVQDITDAMIERARIEHERDHDSLTDLLSRQAYYRRVEELFRDREALKTTAFIMVDLDNLKFVNDTYGHSFGDIYIRTAADMLKKFEAYGGIVARLSGDEFNICLSGYSSKEEVRQIIADVRAELLASTCLLADGTHYKVAACMGVSWYPDDAESRELLMKYADFAMYTVKHATKAGIAEFDPVAYAAASASLTDLEELNRVIEEECVRYAFQSIISVRTGEIYGYEALMRIQSDIFRSPLELLSIAKASAKLQEIERLTWIKAMADFQALLDAGKVDPNARLFINSIANHKLDDAVVAEISAAHPVLFRRIVMEILESEGTDEESITHKKQMISQWGGQLALDDYGTGYNGEYALLSLQPNIIKIDRSIISGCDQDPDRRMIIENMVNLARVKNIRVLAEGVETEAELRTVIACGVEFLQGFYLARPQFEPEPLDPALADTIRRLANDR